ncbi:MAG: AI-2E family transporter [Lachnospiraceae bacterium]|nr:AI-2E family transporter [Lachnospiraceae bacterium]
MKHKIVKNNKYYTISVYTLVTIIIAAICIKIIMNIESTLVFLSSIIGVLSSFLLGFFIAYIINPLAKFISQSILKNIFRIKPIKIRKVISVLLAYIIVFGLIATILFYIIPQIVDTLSQISTFIESAQTGYNKVMAQIKAIEEKNPSWDLQPVYEFIEGIPSLVSDFITDKLPQILPAVFSTSFSVISGVINFLIAVIVSIYMLTDKPHLINNAKKLVYVLFKTEKADKIITTAGECNKIFGDFIIGKMIDSLIIGILCWIAMTALNIPYALVISVVVGITNMIPYFGPFIGAIPGVVLLIIVDIKFAIIFAILILILQQFDGLYLGPKILGESTGLRPIWIIFAITVGGWAAGVVGMFLGVPVTAVIAYLVDKSIKVNISKKNIVFEENKETGIMDRSGMIVDETEYQVKVVDEEGE